MAEHRWRGFQRALHHLPLPRFCFPNITRQHVKGDDMGHAYQNAILEVWLLTSIQSHSDAFCRISGLSTPTNAWPERPGGASLDPEEAGAFFVGGPVAEGQVKVGFRLGLHHPKSESLGRTSESEGHSGKVKTASSNSREGSSSQSEGYTLAWDSGFQS